MKWFRLYAEVATDVKVQRLPGERFKLWINLLCLAADNPKGRGVLPDLEQLSFLLHMSVGRLTAELQNLEHLGLIDRRADGALVPHNWDGRQRKSDDVAQRVRETRKKQKWDDVTLPVTDLFGTGNGAVTPSRAPDSDPDTETEENPPPSPPQGGTAAAAGPLPSGD